MPLRRLEESDLEMVLSWRNAPSVREAMYTRRPISWEEHQSWFQRIRNDASCRWMIFETIGRTPAGVVYLVDLDMEQSTAFWGFYACPDAQSGTGTRMLQEALRYAFVTLKLHKLCAEVLETNCRSLYLHERFGFVCEGKFRDQYFNGEQYIDVVRFGLLSED